MQTSRLAALIEALQVLPGVGQKTAQRMAYYLLERQREGGLKLAQVLEEALKTIGHCSQCRNFSDTDLCPICADSCRTEEQICVVQSPADIEAIEQTGIYSGRYFVLMGLLSPIDGIGPDALGLDQLQKQLETRPPQELILALPPSVEGDATAWYLQQQVEPLGVRVTRLAQGVPVGAELEYVDARTLAQALQRRH